MSTAVEANCSTASTRAGELTIGSAPEAAAWVCLEQSGSWGPKAFTSSHLDPAIGKAFEAAALAAGVRPQLIRSPGRHPDAHSTKRTLLIAYTAPGSSWLLQGHIENPSQVLALDFAAIAQGIRPDATDLTPVSHPVLLVCTHARRDVCCAIYGREVAARTASTFPGQVWETSHLSGHRFAATSVLLPSGHVHGRVLDGSAILAAANRHDLVATGWRGRSTWSPAGQAAEWAVREREGIWDLDTVEVRKESGNWRVIAGASSSLVSVHEFTDGQASPSCGKAPEPVRRFEITIQ